jgi:D-threo-aldose 1-dehydrogenase
MARAFPTAGDGMSVENVQARLRTVRPFGYGASALGNLYRTVSDAEARATVDAAWDLGIRYFDTAPYYGFGLSERRLGDALRCRPRDEFLLSTKVGRLLRPIPAARPAHGFESPMPFEPVYDYSYDGVMRSFEGSLQRLGLSRIDILYMHDLGRLTHGDDGNAHFATAMSGGFRALAELRASGAVGAVGLGVNEIEVCEASFAHADFDLFMVAGCYTLLRHQSLGFLETCRARGVGIVGAGVFNSGILATGTRTDGPLHYDYAPAPPEIVDRVRRLEEISATFDLPLPAAALQMASAHPAILCTVIGTGSAARLRQTGDQQSVTIPREYWSALMDRELLGKSVPVPG